MEDVFASTKNRTISRGILSMDKQRNQLAKVIQKISHHYFDVHAKSMSLNKEQYELLSSVITHLMMAQSNLNKYVKDTIQTQKAND